MTHSNGVLFRFLIFSLLLSSLLQALPKLSAPSKSIATELKASSLYQEASRAISNKLPQIAVNKLRLLLQQNDNWSPQAKSYISLTLAESLIHAAQSDKNPSPLAEEALKILKQDSIGNLPTTIIWQAEALAAMNHYQDASHALSKIGNNHPLYGETLITRARLLIAITKYDAALVLLQTATQSDSSKIKNTAFLLASEINIIRDDFTAAHDSLEKASSTTPLLAKHKEYLQAQLSLKEPQSTDSVVRFQALIANSKPLTKENYHSCLLGLADAYKKTNANEKAIATLIKFITEHPHSPLLPDAFTKLSQLTPPDLPNDHPTITILRQWSNVGTPESNIIFPDLGTAKTVPYYKAQPLNKSDIESLALYHRAVILTKSENTQSHAKALSLLTKLRTKNFSQNQEPSTLYSQLSAVSLIDTAYLQLILGDPNSAAFTLSLMDSITSSSRLKEHAHIVRGLLLDEANDFKNALQAFQSARFSTTPQLSSTANMNAGIVALKASKLDVFQKILDTTSEKKIRTALFLERALWSSSQGRIQGRDDLQTFLANNPEHPRQIEARLALAEAWVSIAKQDIERSNEQLKIISSLKLETEQIYRTTLIQIKASEFSKNWTAAADAAQNFITRFPNYPQSKNLTLKRGTSYFQNGDYNKARLVFKELANEETDSSLSNYANFYSAMAARLSGTDQAREESIKLFQSIINNDSDLAAESRIQQSRMLIDLRRYDEATKTLQPLLKTGKKPSIHHLGAGILMADCLYRQGTTDTQKYEQASLLYKKLLTQKNLTQGQINHLNFLLGKTYESMGLPEQAFETYYSALESKQTKNHLEYNNDEWTWFYQCSFQALSILEAQSRWEAAVKLARNIARYQGPRAEEATNRAGNIAKKHLIWEDTSPATQ